MFGMESQEEEFLFNVNFYCCIDLLIMGKTILRRGQNQSQEGGGENHSQKREKPFSEGGKTILRRGKNHSHEGDQTILR